MFHFRSRHPLTALAAVMILTIPYLTQAQAPYTVTDLGTLGGSTSSASGINNSSVVVGHTDKTGTNFGDGYYWQNGVMTGLGLIGQYGAPTAHGINDNASFQIVGTYYTLSTNMNETYEYFGYLWQNGNFYVLPSLGFDTFAYKINNAGQIAGSSVNSNSQTHACLWYYNGQIFTLNDLGTLPGGAYSQAFDVNAYGFVGGWSSTNNGNDHAVYWDSTGIHDLGVLPGGSNSYCNALAPAVSVLYPVGQSETLDLNGQLVTHACVFPGSDLGTLGGDFSSAAAVNDYAQIVGYSQVADGSNSAFLYSGYGTVMYDLNTMIPSNSGWQLQFANANNDLGQITGSGTINGNVHAFLLTPAYHIKSLTVKPTTVVGSLTATGTVTLDAPAPFDLGIFLSGGASALPEGCVIPAEQTSQSFLIDTTAVSATKTVTISATLYGSSKSASLTIRPIGVKSLKLSPSTVKGGNSVTGKVTLEAQADPGNIVVTLSSSNSAVANPAVSSLTIPRGASTDTFTINTSAVASNTVVTISTTANGITKSAKLTVTP